MKKLVFQKVKSDVRARVRRSCLDRYCTDLRSLGGSVRDCMRWKLWYVGWRCDRAPSLQGLPSLSLLPPPSPSLSRQITSHWVNALPEFLTRSCCPPHLTAEARGVVYDQAAQVVLRVLVLMNTFLLRFKLSTDCHAPQNLLWRHLQRLLFLFLLSFFFFRVCVCVFVFLLHCSSGRGREGKGRCSPTIFPCCTAPAPTPAASPASPRRSWRHNETANTKGQNIEKNGCMVLLILTLALRYRNIIYSSSPWSQTCWQPIVLGRRIGEQRPQGRPYIQPCTLHTHGGEAYHPYHIEVSSVVAKKTRKRIIK